MKRLISILLVFVLLISIVPCAFAAGKKFDYRTVLGSRYGYGYDTTNEFWYFYRFYAKTYTDALLIIQMGVYGEDGGSNPDYADLRAAVYDNNGDVLSPVTSIEFEIGEDVYSYETMCSGREDSYVVLGTKGEKLIQAIADCNASNVSLRVETEDQVYRFEADRSKFTDTLKEFCRIYTKYEIGSYVRDRSFSDGMETEYPLMINGEPA